jgi:hypothetical protein
VQESEIIMAKKLITIEIDTENDRVAVRGGIA